MAYKWNFKGNSTEIRFKYKNSIKNIIIKMLSKNSKGITKAKKPLNNPKWKTHPMIRRSQKKRTRTKNEASTVQSKDKKDKAEEIEESSMSDSNEIETDIRVYQ